MIKRIFFLLLAFGLLGMWAVAQAAGPAIILDKPSLVFKPGETGKQLVSVTLGEDPGAVITIKIVPPNDGTVLLGKTAVVFQPGATDFKTAHQFGVSITGKAKDGQRLDLLLTGQVNRQETHAHLTVIVAKNGQDLTLQVVDPNQIPGANITIPEILPTIVGWLLTLIAVGAFFSLIYSGILYITAGGDAAKAGLARRNIVWALTGIVIALLSYALVRLVTNFATNSPTSTTAANQSATTANTGLLNSTVDLRGRSIATYFISNTAQSFSTKVGVKLLTAPTAPVSFTVLTEGALPIATRAINTLEFTKDNYQTPQFVVVQYGGNGAAGQKANVIFKRSDGVISKVAFTTDKATTTTSVNGCEIINDGTTDPSASTSPDLVPDCPSTTGSSPTTSSTTTTTNSSGISSSEER